MKKRIAIIILAIIILQYFCNFAFAQSDNIIANNVATNEITNSVTNTLSEEEQKKLEEQRNELSDKIDQTNVQLEYVQGELSDTMIQVQEAEDKVLEYEREIEEQQVQIDSLQTSINDSINRLALASQDYNEKKDILANRLVAMYEAGDTQYLDVLLKSTSIVDFISRYYIIEEMAQYDNQLINDIKEEKENIETTQAKLQEEQSQIREVKAKNEQTSIVLSNMKTLQSNYAEKLTEDEKKLQKEITAYKKELAETEAQIMAASNIDVDIQL